MESATERGVLMEVTAPHLTRAMPYVVPFTSDDVEGAARDDPRRAASAGDVLRRGAGTSADTLPAAAPALDDRAAAAARRACARSGLDGGMLSWDGQLEDDARLVTTIARTAASFGAHVRTRARVLAATGTSVRAARRAHRARPTTVTARAVVNATGVWAGDLVDEVTLRPSRGTHLVLRADTLPGLTAAVFAPVPGATNRFVMVLPQPDGTLYVGLTDEPVEGEVPDVPDAVGAPRSASCSTSSRRRSTARCTATTSSAPTPGCARCCTPTTARPPTSRAATRCCASAAAWSPIVGGKLTTYRRMAEDTLDAVTSDSASASPASPRTLPLLGAAPRAELAALEQPRPAGAPLRHRRRAGARHRPRGHRPRATTSCSRRRPRTVPVTLAELVFGVTHEGAHDAADLLDRRTRVGLVAADRDAALAARRARARPRRRCRPSG